MAGNSFRRAESVDYTIAAGDSQIHWLVIPRLGGSHAQASGGSIRDQ